jgi:hypothetical protein
VGPWRRNIGFPSGFKGCNTVTGIYQKDFSTPSHIRFLYASTILRVPPLEMTLRGDCFNRWKKMR